MTGDRDRLLKRAIQNRDGRPLFVAVELRLPQGRILSGFVRDIASNRVGLLSTVLVPSCSIEIAIPDLWGKRFELDATTIASSPIYPGWYATEADLLERGQNQTFLLWLARKLESLNRRATERYALFEAAQLLPTHGALQHVLVRDVSEDGVGIAHAEAIAERSACLIGAHGEELKISRAWQSECLGNLVISGWRFDFNRSQYLETF